MKKEGFNVYTEANVIVHPTEKITVNGTLHLGTTATQVTVSAAALSVNTESSQTGGTVTGTDVQQLLINGRTWTELSILVPGINAMNNNGENNNNTVVNGVGASSNEYMIDGIYNKDAQDGQNIAQFPLDAIAEVQVVTASYNARYAAGGSGQFLAVSKSGTQQFHGSAYEYLRNSALDANNFFSPSVPVLKYNNFGYSIGGPVYIPGVYNTDKRKTFFFWNQEGRYTRGSGVVRGLMLPQSLRGGDFTNSVTLPASGLSLDASSQALLAATFPGVNCVPDSKHINPACIDPLASDIMTKYWPLPNIPGETYGNPNYINPAGGSAKTNQWDYSGRVDHNFSDALRLFGRVSYESVNTIDPYSGESGNIAPTENDDTRRPAWNFVTRLTWNVSPRTINELSFGGSNDVALIDIENATLPSGWAPLLNLPYHGDPYHRIPDISIGGGWDGIGASYLPLHGSNGTTSLADDFTAIRGNHTLQFGGVWMAQIKRQDNVSFPEGSYSFGGAHTGDPAADFLLGLDSDFSQNSTERRTYEHFRRFEAYVQDDWKVRRTLTLNIGVRDQYFTSDKAEETFTDFDPLLYNPAVAPQVLPNGLFVLGANGNPLTASGTAAEQYDGIVYTGQNGVPKGIFTTPDIFLEPRFGFAWDVFGDGKTSLRGGYGIGSDQVPFGAYDAVGNPPFVSSINLINGTLENPLAGIAPTAAESGAYMYELGIPGAKYTPSYVQTWSLTVQREIIPSGVLSVAYVGSGARHLEGSSDLNFPLPMSAPSISNPNCLQPGQTIPAGGFNFDPCINLGLVSPDYTRPYLGWSTISSQTDGTSRYYGNSNYNSLQVGFVYRGGHGLTLNTAYNYQKVLGDCKSGSGSNSPINEACPAQNSRDFEAEYGRPGWDRTQVLTFGYVYQLPFLKNQRGFVGKVAGGWGLSGITQYGTGFAFNPGISYGTGGLASRPNCVGSGVNNGPKTLGQWFNTNVFSEPAFGFFGNCGTGVISGPGIENWDTALLKTFRIGEKVSTQFRAEFFNVFNHTNFTDVATGLGSSNFGAVTTARDPRIVEFGLRLDF
jgi:hypothetical protein